MPRILSDMSGAHQRYEEMAVGHVLGGLDAVDAAEFRSHLVGCRHCRMRVAELRGIASELAAAEREERVAARVKTEVARREEDDEEPPHRPWRLPARSLTVVLLLGAFVAIGVLAWNFHLRDVNRTLLDTAVDRERVLSMLASGQLVTAELHDGVGGLVAVEGDEVALDLAGLPAIGNDRWLAVWFLDGEAPEPYESFRASAVQEGRFATHLPHRSADRLVVSVEKRPNDGLRIPDEPEGLVLLDADLP